MILCVRRGNWQGGVQGKKERSEKIRGVEEKRERTKREKFTGLSKCKKVNSF